MKIGSRESKLAMRQTDMFMDALHKVSPDTECQVIGIKALGDIDLTSPLDKLNNVGAFVRELDEAMVKGEIDISVNSLKDIPIDMDPKLTLGAIMTRNSVQDVILPCSLDNLPEGSVVGTASVRRMALLKSVRPDIKTISLRGNIHTRLSKLDSGECDAIILAKAGLERMGIERPMFDLDMDVFVPAPAQGAIAVECRKDDKAMMELLSKVDDRDTRDAVTIERMIMRALGAGCSSPVGILAKKEGVGFRVKAVSFAFTEEPVRLDTVIPAEDYDRHILMISEYLQGKRKELIP